MLPLVEAIISYNFTMRYRKLILLALMVVAAGYVYLTGSIEVEALAEMYTKGSTTLYETGVPLFCCAT